MINKEWPRLQAFWMGAASAFLLTAAAGAATTNVPPVAISVLTHEHFFFDGQTTTRDAVTFPCTAGACNGPGFTSSIGSTDTVIIRFEPPPGMKFAVTRAPGGTETFFFSARWLTNTGDTSSNNETPVVTFENLGGIAPTNTFNLTRVSDNGQAVTTEQHFTVNGDFTFTAINLQFTVSFPLAVLPRTYNPVTSIATPSFGAVRAVIGTPSDATVMAIQPLNQGVDRSWNTAATAAWSTPADWTPNGLPGVNDKTHIILPGNYSVFLDVNPAVNSIEIGGNSGTQTLNTNGRTLTLNGPDQSMIKTNGAMTMSLGSTINNLGTTAFSNNGTIGGPTSLGTVAIQGPFQNELTGVMSLRPRGSSSITLNMSDPVTSTGFKNQGLIQLQCNSPSASAVLNVNTGTLQNNGTINVLASTAGSTRTLGAQLDNFGAIVLNDSCSLTKPSAGHLNRAGATISVNAGTFTVNQSGTGPFFTNKGTISLATGAQMAAGNGLFKNDVTGVIQGTGTFNTTGSTFGNAGVVRPGNNGPGKLQITGPFTQSDTGSIEVDINGLTPGTQHDVLQVSGVANLGGKISATFGNGFLPAVGDQFNIITSAALNGTFDFAFMPGFPDSRHVVLSYGTNDSEGGIAATGNVTATVQMFDNLVVFDPPADQPLPGTPTAGVLGDFDDDGDLDLAVTISAGTSPGSVVTLFNAGTVNGVWQGFSGSIQVPVGIDPSAICTATLDNNNSLDLAVTNRGSNSVTILLNNGSGVFTPQVPTISVGLQPSSIAAANFNGAAADALSSGRIDLVVTNAGSNNFQVLTNSIANPGTFATGPGIPAGNVPVSVDPADVDNDRDVDVVVLNNGSGNVMVYHNNGAGGFSAPDTYTVGPNPRDVIVRNLNGDGLPDIITANAGDGTISILLNKSGAPGTFGGLNNEPITQAVGSNARSLATLDLQGDGDLDVAVLVDVGGSSAVQLLRNDGGPSATFSFGEVLAVGSGAIEVLTGNLGRGISPDIITVNTGIGSLNDGGPPLLPVQPDVSVVLNSTGIANVPPVQVNALTHEHFFNSGSNETITRDMVQFPCTAVACNGPGFTLAIGQNDKVTVRFQPPPGRRFVIPRAPGGVQYLTFWAYWQTGMGDSGSSFPTAMVTFENLTGTAPSFVDGLTYVSNNGQAVVSEHDYTISARCSFTGIRVEFQVPQALAHLSRIYNAVNSFASPSFGCARVVTGAAANATVMRIAPLCPADVNGNEVVNVDDLLAVITGWGACPGPCPPRCAADVAPTNGNCMVNVDDLLAVINGWGPCP